MRHSQIDDDAGGPCDSVTGVVAHAAGAPQRVIAGKYRVTRLLGKGGMGQVFEAMHLATRRVVALKLLSPPVRILEPHERDAQHQRFVREARAVGQVRSRYVVQILDAGLDAESDSPFMAMEYLHGEDLSAVLHRVGPLPPQVAFRIALQAARGLADAHAAGVVHRDVKPANLFLVCEGDDVQTKVVDFGVARILETPGVDLTQQLTTTGAVIGSPAYMAPEQVQGRKDADGRSDVWSLSVALYKMLAGRTPHLADDAAFGALLVDICSKRSPDVRKFAPWVQPGAAALLRRGLEIAPQNRLSMDELIEELATLAGAETITTRDLRALEAHEQTPDPSWSDSDRGPESELPGRRERSRGGRGIAIMAGVAALAAGLGALMGQGVVKPNVPPPVPPVSATPVRESMPRVVRVSVPADVAVEVDGRVAVVAEGGVRVEGELGTTHAVLLRDPQGRSETFSVVIADRGATPDRLAFAPLPPQQPPASTASGPAVTMRMPEPRSAPSARPSSSASAPPAKKPPPGFSTNFPSTRSGRVKIHASGRRPGRPRR